MRGARGAQGLVLEDDWSHWSAPSRGVQGNSPLVTTNLGTGGLQLWVTSASLGAEFLSPTLTSPPQAWRCQAVRSHGKL